MPDAGAISSEDFELYLESIRRFTSDKLIPAERRVEEEDAVPEELVVEMRHLGMFGMTIPEIYGGLGLTMERGSVWLATVAFGGCAIMTIRCSLCALEAAADSPRTVILPLCTYSSISHHSRTPPGRRGSGRGRPTMWEAWQKRSLPPPSGAMKPNPRPRSTDPARSGAPPRPRKLRCACS